MKTCILTILLLSFISSHTLAQSSTAKNIDSILTVGKRHIESQQYREAAVLYLNTSQKLSLNEVEHIEDLCLNGIDAMKFIDDQYLTRMLHLRLAESYLYATQESKVLELEKKILSLDIELLTRDFYGAAAYYQKELLTQHGKDKRARELEEEHQRITNEIQEIKTAAPTVGLPQGVFKYDRYTRDNKKLSSTITIDGSTIIKESNLDELDIEYNSTPNFNYKVQSSVPISDNNYLLCVTSLDYSGDESWYFLILQELNDGLVISNQINFEFDYSEIDEENHVQQMYTILKPEYENLLSEHINARSEIHYPDKRYDSLINLPVIPLDKVSEIKLEFLNKLDQRDDLNSYLSEDAQTEDNWFHYFLIDYYQIYAQDDLEKIIFQKLLIEKGYEPFKSIPILLNYEEEENPLPTDYTTKIFIYFYYSLPFLIPCLLIIGLFFLLRFIYRYARNKKIEKVAPGDQSEQEPTTKKAGDSTKRVSTANRALNVIGFIVLGGIIGLVLGYLGGASSSNFLIGIWTAFIGLIIGSILGLIIGLFKKK